MLDLAIPALYALLVWWLGTGIVLYAARLPARTHVISLSIAAVLAIAALVTIALSARSGSTAAAYLGFTAAIVVWAFVELAFLTGAILGHDRTEALPGAAGWSRIAHAIAAIIHHELALLVGGAAVIVASYGAQDNTALWTYLILWLLRLSAKLNLFMGVPNLHDELLPERLSHLRSHFRRGPMSPLLPVSILLTLFTAVYFGHLAVADASQPTLATTLMLMASLLALAALEHVFMLIPLPVMNLWNWRRSAVATSGTANIRPAITPLPASQRPKGGASINRRGL